MAKFLLQLVQLFNGKTQRKQKDVRLLEMNGFGYHTSIHLDTLTAVKHAI